MADENQIRGLEILPSEPGSRTLKVRAMNGSVYDVADTPEIRTMLDFPSLDVAGATRETEALKTATDPLNLVRPPELVPPTAEVDAVKRDLNSVTPTNASAAPQAPAPTANDMLMQTGLGKVAEGQREQEAGLEAQRKAYGQAQLNAKTHTSAMLGELDGARAAEEEAQATAALGAMARESKLADYQAEREQALKAYDNSKVDPNRLLGDASAGRQLMAGLAVVLGAIGQGLQGGKGENLGIKAIDQAIERDVRVQEQERAKLLGVVDRRGAQVGDAQQDLMQYQQRVNFETERRLRAVNRYLDILKVKNEGTELGTKAAALQGEIQVKIGEQQQKAGEFYLSMLKKADGNPEQIENTQKFVNANKGLGAYAAAAQTFSELRSADPKDAAQVRTAIAKYVASQGGLAQGSFGETFSQQLKSKGFLDSAGNVLEERFGKGYNPAIYGAILSLASKNVESLRKQNSSAIDYVKKQEKAIGYPGLFSLPEVEPSLGFKPKK